MEEKAKAAVEAFVLWVLADGFDCPEYDGVFRAMRELAESVGMMERWYEMREQ